MRLSVIFLFRTEFTVKLCERASWRCPWKHHEDAPGL